MATKQIIYQKKQEDRNFSTTPIKSLLYRQMCMEEYRANVKVIPGENKNSNCEV